MTNLSDILDLMLPLIPDDIKLETIDDIDLAKKGVYEMAVALNFDDFEVITDIVEEDGVEKKVLYCSPTLNFKQKSLASYFTYRTYLLKLKESFTRDAINFSTLTFSIKGLEKRPEMINDSLYQVNRYLQAEIDRAGGSSAIVGTAVAFGGSTNEG